jgi:hypothetical protein
MKTKLTYIVELDFKGSIPSFVVSQVTKKQPMQIDIIRNFLKEEESNCGGRDLFLKKYNALDKLVNLGEIEETIVSNSKINTNNSNINGCSQNQMSAGTIPLSLNENSDTAVSNSVYETKISSRRNSSLNFPKRPISRKSWSEDNQHKSCQKCNEFFSLFIRRHHCRYCGQVLCDKCSKYLLNNRRSCLDCFHNGESVNIDESKSL